MSKKQKSKGITIANIVSLVGLVALLVFSFLGLVFKRGGEVGMSILLSVVIVLVGAFLLWLMIKAKGAENDLKRWRVVELSTVAAYVIFAVFASWQGGLMHFFVVNDHKEAIKGYAEADFHKIDAMFAEFKSYEEQALTNTENGLYSATGLDQRCSQALTEFIQGERMSATRDGVKNYKDKKKKDIDDYYNGRYDQFLSRKSKIGSAIDNWSVMRIAFNVDAIDRLAQQFADEFTSKSDELRLPLIIRQTDGSYDIKGYQYSDFDVEGGVSSLQFRSAITGVTGFSIMAVVVALLIHLIVLFNYFVAYRTLVVKGGSGDDGGIPLE